ncbi:phage baseplate assembly protein V [Paenibacillus sp. F411]|uniref:phage baseplate assembly protein V n=1 Tax=Paenibacillus sp. F411 TaxID=2820239 RepID=UPI001AAE2D94|nr:phage baseplate assembly protein V [Paenibacillus sp. F411]MBO2943587.1 phage baseplate assembly protein V [Paenibacillus sp. F411]
MGSSQFLNIFRIGVCSTADPESGTITATFEDRQDMVSGDLPVLTPGGWARRNELPEPGQVVACLFLANGVSDGICLGVIEDEEDPAGTADQRGMWFEDGSYVYYDRTSQQLKVKAAGGVTLEGDVTIAGNLTVDGSITRGGENL